MSFSEQVWDLTKKIPEGRVSTYKILAEKLNTKAYRAVGNALNKNPYAPKVPCHRVVCTDGSLGGFAKGVKEKIGLLEKEGLMVKNNKIIDFKNKLFSF